MKAFDTDIPSELLLRNVVYTQRADPIPSANKVVPVAAIEEVLRGRLDAIEDTRPYQILPYTAAAHALVQQWQQAKIRVGTNDLRIAAICIDHGATLVTRNARDYARVPGLTFDVWN